VLSTVLACPMLMGQLWGACYNLEMQTAATRAQQRAIVGQVVNVQIDHRRVMRGFREMIGKEAIPCVGEPCGAFDFSTGRCGLAGASLPDEGGD
jgi:hypothetical protein